MVLVSSARVYGKRALLWAALLCVGVALSLSIPLSSAWADEASANTSAASPDVAAAAVGDGDSADDANASDLAGGCKSADVADGMAAEGSDEGSSGNVGGSDAAGDSGSAGTNGDADLGDADEEVPAADAGDADDAEAAEGTEADEDASSCHSESSDEDASSRHPEQASEASASKDLDATVQAEAATAEVAEDDDAATTAAIEYVNMYRLYNPNSGEHFYTSSLDEATSVTEAGWRYEGVGWVAPKTSAAPVYRLYNPNAGDHHYTQSLEERNTLVAAGWKYEGIGWYSEDSDDGIAVLRQYNPNAVSGAHNFTTSSDENGSLVSAGWSGEGIAWYASSQATQSIQGRWIVTSAWGSLERYWLDSTATIAKSRLVDPTTALDSGAGYRAYAKSDGAVVRGSYDSGAGYVYLADEDGKLVSGTANDWLVTDVYAGSMQRYYLVSVNNIIVAKTSSFTIDGNNYYGLADVGYVLRGKLRYGAGMLLADNDGVLAWTEGWLVTGIYDGGVLQRYRIDTAPGDGLMGARVGEFTLEGNLYCGSADEGYVYRNVRMQTGGKIYEADNEGVLTYLSAESAMLSRISGYGSGTGWLIAVDRSTHKVGVFSGYAGNWSLEKYFSCVTGASGTPTITGLYHTTGGKKYALSTDARAIYCTQIWGGYFFHSVLDSTSELGQSLSHGCIRLAWDDANWIYRNIWGGTTVYIYN